MKNVLAVGHCTLDQIGLVERLAGHDEEVEMMTYSEQGGGTAATAAVALARWGAKTQFVGKVGDDARGDHIVRTLEQEGVDISAIVRQHGAISQVRHVIAEMGGGQRTAYSTPGTVEPLAVREVDTSVVDGADLVVVDGWCSSAKLELLERAKTREVPVILEADHGRKVAAKSVRFADVVVASEREASAYTGVGDLKAICEAFIDQGPTTAIVTLGDEGAVAMRQGGDYVRLEAPSVEVVDTTGAGDVFLASIAWAYLKDWPLEKAVMEANRAAALACTGPGGRSQIVVWDN